MYIRRIGMLIVTVLLVLCGDADAQDSDSLNTQDPPESGKSIEQLIDDLVEVSEPGFGYSVYFSGTEFLPYEGTQEMGTAVFGGTYSEQSDTLRQIVEKGASAVPVLLKHLDDDRNINMPPTGGLQWIDFADEYDFNERTQTKTPEGVNRGMFSGGFDHPEQHAFTVGDLCFVALGQIVNRNYSATRYQPSGGLIVSSPTYSEKLRQAILADWSGLTEERHRRSLVEDFMTPDNDGRRIGAYLRLSLYYPDAVEPLVLDELAKPTVDRYAIWDFCRNTLYKTQDKDERRRMYGAFIREHGKLYSIAIEDMLYADLGLLEAQEQGYVSPQLVELVEFGTLPRELLIQLFGAAADVQSTNRPESKFAYEGEHVGLIEMLIHDDSQKIGDVVKQQFLKSPDDDYLASACLKCLASRGYADFLIEQLSKINVNDSDGNSLHYLYIDAISTSKDARVRDKLLEILRTTDDASYFMAALPAAGDSERELILEQARKLLDGVPDDTEEGHELLEMIGERYPGQAKSIYKEFLETGSAKRAETMCTILWYGDEIAPEVLAPLLDDKRSLPGFIGPMRVCDLAAQAISHTTEEISFDSDWSTDRKDRQIEKLKLYCKQK